MAPVMVDQNTVVLAFVAGLLWGLVILALTVFCLAKADETAQSAGDLFETENMTEDDDDFREFIIKRLAQSSAFRSKAVNGMAKLHQTYPKVYSEVMRK
jgi:hypothetical protein